MLCECTWMITLMWLIGDHYNSGVLCLLLCAIDYKLSMNWLHILNTVSCTIYGSQMQENYFEENMLMMSHILVYLIFCVISIRYMHSVLNQRNGRVSVAYNNYCYETGPWWRCLLVWQGYYGPSPHKPKWGIVAYESEELLHINVYPWEIANHQLSA